jgi:hypothetical protein
MKVMRIFDVIKEIYCHELECLECDRQSPVIS